MFNSCEYVISTVSRKQSPNSNRLSEFVFLGRSNVGKSSFINSLTNRKMLARTSSKPGKTQTINYFLIDKKYYFVDVPGYGYASRSVDNRLDYGKYIEEYLTNNENIKIAFLLIDTKVGPTKDDILMYQYMQYLKLNIVIIGTKCDKVGRTLLINHVNSISKDLCISKDKIILTSSSEKIGFEKVIDLINNSN